MKAIITLLAVITLSGAFAQNAQVFRVSKLPLVALVPNLDTLYTNKEYRFELVGDKAAEVTKIVFSDGKVIHRGNTVIVQTTKDLDKAKNCTLRCTVQRNDTQHLVYSKQYFLKAAPPLPAANSPVRICWWAGDPSGKNRISILRPQDSLSTYKLQGTWLSLFAATTTNISNTDYVVTNFTLKINSGADSTVFKSNSNNFTQPMVNALNLLKQGSTVVVEDVKYYKPRSTEVFTAGPFKIYVVEE